MSRAMPSSATPGNAPLAQYSVWLLPSPEHERRLVDTVARLSALLQGPVFTPHVTLQGDLALTKERLATATGMLARRMPVQRWRVDAVETTPHFFRCLYLRFTTDPAFAAMQAAVQRCSRTRSGLSPYPHLSLAYGEPQPATAEQEHTLQKEFAGQHIVFDRLAIYRSSKHVPIAEWAAVSLHPLRT